LRKLEIGFLNITKRIISPKLFAEKLLSLIFPLSNYIERVSAKDHSVNSVRLQCGLSVYAVFLGRRNETQSICLLGATSRTSCTESSLWSSPSLEEPVLLIQSISLREVPITFSILFMTSAFGFLSFEKQ